MVIKVVGPRLRQLAPEAASMRGITQPRANLQYLPFLQTSNFFTYFIVPPSHIAVVAERPVANAVLVGAESLLGLGASHWRSLVVPAIVIGVVHIPIDDSCNILVRRENGNESVK